MNVVDRRRRPDAEVEGRPDLVLRDEDRETLEDVIADMLIESLNGHQHGLLTDNATR